MLITAIFGHTVQYMTIHDIWYPSVPYAYPANMMNNQAIGCKNRIWAAELIVSVASQFGSWPLAAEYETPYCDLSSCVQAVLCLWLEDLEVVLGESCNSADLSQA